MTGNFSRKAKSALILGCLFFFLPLCLALSILGLWNFDLSVPIIYGNSDDIWQLILTKVLTQTGWVLTNPYLGAPDVASWHHNAAAQTSSLHSVLMYLLSFFFDDSVKVQQIYYLLNFPLIVISGYVAARLLGIRRIYAYAIGLLFAFTSYRIHFMLYAFLSNYFPVPIVIATIILLLAGRFDNLFSRRANESIIVILKKSLKCKPFAIGLVAIAAIAISDGYYAFFTLLLLGFVFLIKLILFKNIRSPALMPPVIFITLLLGLVVVLNVPLEIYKHTHKEEFAPNGKIDSTLVKHDYEAEFYSTSLKLMISPIGTHRIEAIANLGNKMVASSDNSRIFKIVNTNASLGFIGTVGLVVAFLSIFLNNIITTIRGGRTPIKADNYAYSGATLSVILFIFLCSIYGGVGTLIALVFPTIRAYDRFVVFLHFSIFLYLGLLLTRVSHINWGTRKCWIWGGCAVVIVAAGIYDQTPRDSYKYDQNNISKFLNERRFIHAIEDQLKPGAMVYQYPYSQYLRQNKYYGWGAFSHVRFYLHSKDLRWSNGGAKNSPADDWNFRLSKQEMNVQLSEIESLGFAGVLIDGSILTEEEYQKVKSFFLLKGLSLQEDRGSKLAFVRLNDSPIHVNYTRDYRSIASIRIDDPSRLADIELPPLINRRNFQALIKTMQPIQKGLVIEAQKYSNVFLDWNVLMKGSGDIIIPVNGGLAGKLSCQLNDYIHMRESGMLKIEIKNESGYDWFLNEGQYPLRIGMHVTGGDGSMLMFDDGYRLPVEGVIKAGSRRSFDIPLKPIVPLARYTEPFNLEFVMVQDGNAWFSGTGCQVMLK